MKEKWKEQIKWGTMVFVVAAAVVAVIFVFVNFAKISGAVGTLLKILSPIIYGAVLAYLFSPIYNRLLDALKPKLKKYLPRGAAARNVAKGIATFLSVLLLIILTVGLVAMIIPQIYTSVMDLAVTLPSNMAALYANAMRALEDYPEIREGVRQMYDMAYDFITGFTQDTLLPNMQKIVASLSIGIFSMLNWFKNIFIGLIVMIYLLNIKEDFLGAARRMIYAVLPKRGAGMLIQEFEYINKVFGGFIIGKIIDSIIIGFICFFALSVLHMPYAMLVSVIVGVTNVIPFFGPFIGAIPSFILILLASPIQSIYFLIFILILQQFDGNILGPKILGNSTGLSSFWVLFSILLFGGLFGFVGMIIAVPTWAVILNLVERLINLLLYRKGMPSAREDYLKDTESRRIEP
ncbi:AI-2E family transporter [Oribacterium sp. HCP28S3_H8]|jgi:predicted PurR-regulated permease PerM|uniref:AI-2E family transporter n=1 Tax=Oribacterium sp. HCP28S3_H8 TaxID=3438945 RepID=UPI003F88D9EF